jgi:hypothetical protein
MIYELACLAVVVFCGKKMYSLRTGKISTAPLRGPAKNEVKERNFNDIIEKIKINKMKREAGTYVPNAMHDTMRANLKRTLKPEVYAQWEKEGKLPGGI